VNAPSTSQDIFATTRWTVVLAAGQRRAPQADVALEELCRTYWFPLYAYVRRHGHSKEDAEDLTQAFFARFFVAHQQRGAVRHRALPTSGRDGCPQPSVTHGKHFFDGLDRERGKFRAFLLASLKHFLANEWDKAQRQKRGGGLAPLSLDWQDADTRYRIDPADTLTPDKLYDRAWAVTLLERVITRLRDECVADNKAKLFEQLRPFLMLGKSAVPYPEVAASLGMNEGAVRTAVHRLRQRYRQLLRDEIAQTLADPAQVEEELRALFDAFTN
jgi:RNA polymerase sigma-70 factor (ECF subfamily)